MLTRIKAVGLFFWSIGASIFYLALMLLAWIGLCIVIPFVSKKDRG